jgi:hypothetical protein
LNFVFSLRPTTTLTYTTLPPTFTPPLLHINDYTLHPSQLVVCSSTKIHHIHT